MSVQVDVRGSMRGFSARLDLLKKEQMAAAVRALNKTMTTVRAEASRSMQKEFPGVKAGTLKRQMRIKRATRVHPVATLTFSNKRLRLFGNFRMRSVGPFGVRFNRLPWRIETGSGQEVPASALQAAFRQRANGVANVWIRLGRARYPIEVLVAPSLSSAFVERRIAATLARVARTRFAVVFQQEANFQLARRA